MTSRVRILISAHVLHSTLAMRKNLHIRATFGISTKNYADLHKGAAMKKDFRTEVAAMQEKVLQLEDRPHMLSFFAEQRTDMLKQGYAIFKRFEDLM